MLIEAEVWTVARTEQGNAVLVRPLGAEVAVPIFIGQLEAQSILIGLGNVPMPRPLTHDLFLSVLERLEAAVKRVEITSLKSDTFYARLILERNGSEIAMDARPSDSLALAVRVKCPVYIAEAVVESSAISVNLIVDEESSGEKKTGEEEDEADEESEDESAEARQLKKALERAVENEDYEEAARIRDKMKDLGI